MKLLAIFGISVLLFSTNFAAAQVPSQADKTCVILKGDTVPKVCVGAAVQSHRPDDEMKPWVSGTVSKIEIGVAEDGKRMGILSVQTKDGVARITSRGFVFMTPGTCVQDTRSQDRICLGEQYKSERDGRTYEVTGFAVTDGQSFGSQTGVVVRDTQIANSERTTDTMDIYSSHAVAATGKMSRVGSCDSEIPYLDKMGYGSLPGCATSQAADLLKNACRSYCAGEGHIAKGDVDPATPSCEVQPNMFPPHKKVCSVTLTAKCNCAK